MAYTQPILGSYTLPHISGYEETRGFRGAMVEMADSTIHFDNVVSTPKRTYVLSWTMISDTDKATIENAYDALATVTKSFTPPTGAVTTTVTRTKTELKFVPLKATEGLLWSTSMELREV